MRALEPSLVFLVMLGGCTGTGASTGDMGRLELGLGSTSAAVATPPDEAPPAADVGVSEVLVSVDEVSVHSDSEGWKSVRSDSFVVDLLSLPAHPIIVGSVALFPGNVTQVRLITGGGSVITSDGQPHPLTVPSGMQTGIKIAGRWRVDACRSIALHLEFEPPAFVHLHSPGEGDGWVLNPVIHVAQDPPVLFLGCGGIPVLKE